MKKTFIIIFLFLSIISHAQVTRYGTSAGSLGTWNSNFGYYANSLATNSTIGNSSFGHYAGYKSVGSLNSFFGYQSGYNTTSGAYNVFLGSSAGYANTTGQANNFLGLSAGYNNTTGSGNTFIGYYTGYYHTTGQSNIFIGNQSGYKTTTGIDNVFLGVEAGYNNVTGNGNVFLGDRAGYNETGSNKLYISNSATNNLIYGDFANGRVGINNRINPQYTLDVNGVINATGLLINGIPIGTSTNSYWVANSSNIYFNTGNVGIGTTNPLYKLQVTGNVDAQSFTINGVPFTGASKWSQNAVGIYYTSGKVAIGTATFGNGDYKLYVENGIRTRKVNVDSDSWADFVFEATYPLMSLSELERFIQTNKHLPDVPSEKELQANGLDLGEMQKIQMQKIEELTLYLIELKKENEVLKKRIENLEQK